MLLLLMCFSRVLDDLEMYEEQKPFTLSDMCAISYLLNHFVFKAIWGGLAGELCSISYSIV